MRGMRFISRLLRRRPVIDPRGPAVVLCQCGERFRDGAGFCHACGMADLSKVAGVLGDGSLCVSRPDGRFIPLGRDGKRAASPPLMPARRGTGHTALLEGFNASCEWTPTIGNPTQPWTTP